MKLFTYLNSSESPPKPWRLPALAPPSAAESLARKKASAQRYSLLWVGTQVMPYAVVINARKSPRDFYDD